MMEYKRTRNDLLKLTRVKRLVEYGESVLKKKTILLSATLLATLLNYKKDMDSENAIIAGAMRQIRFAIAFDGVQSVLSASNLIVNNMSLGFKTENLIGTFIPSLLLKDMVVKRDYGEISTSLRLEGASNKFEQLFRELIVDVDLYIRIRKLSAAISRTKSRYNALNKKLLPALNLQEKSISEFLESAERQESFNTRNLLV